MVFFLRKYLLYFFLFSFSKILCAEKGDVLPYPLPPTGILSAIDTPDTAAHNRKKSTKICSCQILILQINQRRQKHFALFVEKTNKKSFASDVSFTIRVLEREKRHMQSFFYDKLEVVGTFSDATDCRSMYRRLKDRNKSLFLYDILDADIRR
jgi:hypothetical protein